MAAPCYASPTSNVDSPSRCSLVSRMDLKRSWGRSADERLLQRKKTPFVDLEVLTLSLQPIVFWLWLRVCI